MNQSTLTPAQTARFSEAVRTFAPICASRYAKLLPFREGIAELRQKGASYRLIRELLATVDVAVAVDTIGGFVREVIEQRPPPAAPPRRPVRPVTHPSAARRLPTPSEPQFPFTVAPPVEQPALEPVRSVSPDVPISSPPPERPRTRGPRIADPTTL